MVTKQTSDKKTTRRVAPKVKTVRTVRSSRSSKAISPQLAAYSNGLADAVARGVKLGTPAAQVAALTAASAVVDDHSKMSAKKRALLEANPDRVEAFAGKLAAQKATSKKKANRAKKSAKVVVLEPVEALVDDQRMAALVNDLKAQVFNWGYKDRKSEYDGVRRGLARMCKMQGGTQRMGDKIVLRMGTPHLQPGSTFYAGGWQDLLNKKKMHSQKRVGAHKGWPEWMEELGWVPGKGHNSSGESTTGAKIKQSRPTGRTENREPSQKVAGRVRSSFNSVRDQKMWKPEEVPFSEMDKTPCVVPNCEQYSRRPFEARGVRGMEPADGKAVCRTHGEVLIAISRSSLDWTKKELMVEDLLDRGQEPDPDLLASAKPAQRQAPVRAHAVNPAAVTAFIAAGAILSAPPSHNGHGQKSGNVPCMVCGENNAPAGPRWQWKVEVHDDLKSFVADPQNSGRVCQTCGPSFFAIGKKPIADQPAALAGMIAAKATPGKRPSATTPAMAQAVAKEDFPGYVFARRQAMNVSAQAVPATDKKPCPVPQCKLVLLKVNLFKSAVPGMGAANGVAYCGAHVKALAGIAHQNVTPEERAKMVDAILHPAPAKDDGFEQAMDLAGTNDDDAFETEVDEATEALFAEPTGAPA